MKLQPRTTYISNGGWNVNIAGYIKIGTALTGDGTFEGMPILYSIQGDWYSEDGRRVSYTGSDHHRCLLGSDARDSIAREDTSEEAKRWWNGVTVCNNPRPTPSTKKSSRE